MLSGDAFFNRNSDAQKSSQLIENKGQISFLSATKCVLQVCSIGESPPQTAVSDF